MKYIRTKDGIYENEGLLQSNSIYDEPSILVCGGHRGVNIKNIINQADTIEELCDEFVLLDKDDKRYFPMGKDFFGRLHEDVRKAMHIANRYIYGAIWTSKGLMYIAKMNEKGEMELL